MTDSTYKPLADEIRPKSLDDVVGQQHILGRDGLLRRIVESGSTPNMIFYGPSGTGKTTVARIIAERTQRSLRKLNATTAGISDIKKIIDELDTFLTPGGVLLYLVFGAILSRSTVFEFKPVSARDAETAVQRAVEILNGRRERPLAVEDGVVRRIAQACGGDVRKAINAVELLFSASNGRELITLEDAVLISQKSAMRYDRDGDEHFDILSAMMKSLRGSDPDAALHYLARAIEVGDLTGICRRILCSASEDIGMAYPQAVPIVKACVDSALQLGLPEARLPLAEACILLATAPKSNSVVMAIDEAIADVKAGRVGSVPRELQNVHADGTGFEREQGYLYPHEYPGHWVQQQYLPDELRNQRYYEYGDNKTEQAAKKYWDSIKGK